MNKIFVLVTILLGAVIAGCSSPKLRAMQNCDHGQLHPERAICEEIK